MKVRILMVLVLASLLTLSGCSRLAVDRRVVWAQLGTPARIVDDTTLKVLIPKSDGSWEQARSSLKGMVAIDEPTLHYYQKLDQAKKAKQK